MNIMKGKQVTFIERIKKQILFQKVKQIAVVANNDFLYFKPEMICPLVMYTVTR